MVFATIGKQKDYPELISRRSTQRRYTPKDREKIDWNCSPICLCAASGATEKLDWYAQRWKIETYHKSESDAGGRSEAENGRTLVTSLQSYAS